MVVRRNVARQYFKQLLCNLFGPAFISCINGASGGRKKGAVRARAEGERNCSGNYLNGPLTVIRDYYRGGRVRKTRFSHQTRGGILIFRYIFFLFLFHHTIFRQLPRANTRVEGEEAYPGGVQGVSRCTTLYPRRRDLTGFERSLARGGRILALLNKEKRLRLKQMARERSSPRSSLRGAVRRFPR